jgi:metal transporter CNNM
MNYFLYGFLILFCIIQSGITSGLTLSLFGFPRLRLESEASAGNDDAVQILKYRKDSHLLLATLIWANVSFNVLLAFLTESIMNAYVAFVFTTFLITFIGEIFPQAYISRRALSVGSKLSPLISIYKFITYPLAKPTAYLLDKLIGKECYDFFTEETIKEILKRHLESSETEVDKLEGQGALNFLDLDDMSADDEGENILAESLISIDHEDFNIETPINEIPVAFFERLASIKKKWAILLSKQGTPEYALNINSLLRESFLLSSSKKLSSFCHRPIVINDFSMKLGDIISRFKVFQEHQEDDVIDLDIIIFWSDDKKKIITGADILGRLLRGVVKVTKLNPSTSS